MSTQRRQLAALYGELARTGLNTGSFGNVSARTGRGMLITPSGGTAASVTAKSLVPMGLDGTVKGRARPSSEWEMHAAIYAAEPAAKVIVHTHSDHASALACLGEALPAFHYAVLAFGGAEVPVTPYATFGTGELARVAVAAMAGYNACLLANHGMICHGRDAAEALDRAVLLETLARQYMIARAAGTPRLLSADEIEQARLRFRSYGQRQQDRTEA